MSDISFVSTIGLGKVNEFQLSKVASIDPISFPGQDASEVEAIDTLGIIAYYNISGRITGSFQNLQSTIYDIRNITDGMQTAGSTLRSPFVNTAVLVGGSKQRRQGQISSTTGTVASQLIDTTVNFPFYGISAGDKVKNLITGEVANITGNSGNHTLLLDDNIFTVTGTPYAATASMRIKIISSEFVWGLPGLSWVDYKISVVQIKE